MSRPSLGALLLLAAVASAPLRAAEGTPVAVTLDPPALTVGDPVEATLEVVVAGDGSEVRFPDWSRGWGEAEVLDASEVERTVIGDGVRLRQRLRLTAFKPGEIALPPIALRIGAEGGSATTPEGLKLEVRSVLPPDDAEAAPLPPEPPRRYPVPPAALWSIASLIAAIAAALWLARRRSRAGAPALAAAPLDELLAALAALPVEAPEPGHARLSAILRRYLGRALDFHAVESSTREVERALAARHLDPALIQRTARLLRESDLVKFGRRPATMQELSVRAADARSIGEAVESHLRPAPADGTGAEAAA